MKCTRCGGLQLWCHFANLGPTVGAWAYDGWRCMNCGNVVDSLILENRSMQQAMTAPANRVRPYGGHIIWLRTLHQEEPNATADSFRHSSNNEWQHGRLKSA